MYSWAPAAFFAGGSLIKTKQLTYCLRSALGHLAKNHYNYLSCECLCNERTLVGLPTMNELLKTTQNQGAIDFFIWGSAFIWGGRCAPPQPLNFFEFTRCNGSI